MLSYSLRRNVVERCLSGRSRIVTLGFRYLTGGLIRGASTKKQGRVEAAFHLGIVAVCSRTYTLA